MTRSLNSAIVRIRNADDRVIGVGFLVGQRKVLTCVHVIALALGVPDDATEVSRGEVQLDFPLVASKHRLTTRVVLWKPTDDIAGLELLDAPPAGAHSVRLAKDPESLALKFAYDVVPLLQEYQREGLLKGLFLEVENLAVDLTSTPQATLAGQIGAWLMKGRTSK